MLSSVFDAPKLAIILFFCPCYAKKIRKNLVVKMKVSTFALAKAEGAAAPRAAEAA